MATSEQQLQVADVSEMVGLLHELSPGRITALQTEMPEFRNELRQGRTLGKSSYRTYFMLRVASEAVDAAIPAAESYAAAANRRLNRALRLDFLAHALALLGSSGTLLFLLMFGRETKTVATAVCSLLGSLCVVAVGLYRSGTGGGKNTLTNIHVKLAMIVPELKFMAGRLRSFREEDLADSRLNTDALRLVERSEKLCKDVRQWSAEVPGSWHRGAANA